MHRRKLLFATAAFILLGTGLAYADAEGDVVKWLTRQGYSQIEVSRTLLGRVRIIATKDGNQRELVLNPRTGEILRDVIITADGEVHASTGTVLVGADDHGDHGGGDDAGGDNSGGSGSDGGGSDSSGSGDDGSGDDGSGDDGSGGGDSSGSGGGDGSGGHGGDGSDD